MVVASFSDLVRHGQYSDVRRVLHNVESSFAHWDSALDSFFIVDLGVCIKGVEYLPQKVSWLGLVLILSGAGFIVAAAVAYFLPSQTD